MSDLISRDALGNKLSTLYEYYLKTRYLTPDGAVWDCIKLLYNAPTVDAVEVVRCRECKHYIYQWKSDDEQVYGLCGIHGTAVLKSTDFCSYGKRKEVSE